MGLTPLVSGCDGLRASQKYPSAKRFAWELHWRARVTLGHEISTPAELLTF
jgi:hypothetical protein